MAPKVGRGCPKGWLSFEELKTAIDYFLKIGGYEKQAGFSDYFSLLKILKNEVESLPSGPNKKTLLNTIERHKSIILAQDKLLQKPEKKPSRWEKIKAMIRSGLFVQTIMETAEKARSIGLHPIPALPKKQTLLNAYPMLDTINLTDAEHREAGRYLMLHTKAINFTQLCHSIKCSCLELRETILGWDKDYYLLTVNGKSQEWLADIAYRYLPVEKQPAGLLKIDHHSFSTMMCEHLIKTGSDNYILFDDAAYSGSQLYSYLSDLHTQLSMKGIWFSNKKTLYIVYGFMSDAARKKIETFKCNTWNSNILNFNFNINNVEIKVLSAASLGTCKELTDKEHFSQTKIDRIRDLSDLSTPLVTTEWKRPDYVSLSQYVSRGYLGRFNRRDLKPGYVSCWSSIEFEEGIAPITDIIPPYTQTMKE